MKNMNPVKEWNVNNYICTVTPTHNFVAYRWSIYLCISETDRVCLYRGTELHAPTAIDTCEIVVAQLVDRCAPAKVCFVDGKFFPCSTEEQIDHVRELLAQTCNPSAVVFLRIDNKLYSTLEIIEAYEHISMIPR